MNLTELMNRIHEVDPEALPGGPDGATPKQTRLVLAAFNAVRQALNRCNVEDRIMVPGLGQFRLRNDHAATAPGAARRLVLAPEQTLRTERQDQATWVRALKAPMLPLVHPQRRFVVVFFAKSACTSVVIWYLHTMGLLEAARTYSDWPHDFRIDRLYQRAEDAEARDTLRASQVKVLRVVRDPFERAVSSFRHALATGYAREAIQKTIGVDTASQGLSFERFIDFLEREDLQHCDPHHRMQSHALDRLRRPDMTINVTSEDLFTKLNEFERMVGMEETDFRGLSWLQELHAQRSPTVATTTTDAYKTVFSPETALSGPWPKSFLNPEARSRLARLYAEDLRRLSPAAA